MCDYLFRKLNKYDYEKYLLLINEFRTTYFTYEQFINFLDNSQKNTEIIIIEKNNELIASGTILYETKLIHNISLYAHIEDIIVLSKYRNNGIGKLLIKYLIDNCKKQKCYKILLDCSSELINFYEKNNFKKNGTQMVIYL